jgi:hypothetical protein
MNASVLIAEQQDRCRRELLGYRSHCVDGSRIGCRARGRRTRNRHAVVIVILGDEPVGRAAVAKAVAFGVRQPARMLDREAKAGMRFFWKRELCGRIDRAG